MDSNDIDFEWLSQIAIHRLKGEYATLAFYFKPRHYGPFCDSNKKPYDQSR